MIYYANRAGLEDRVWRVKSGRSVSSVVLPRTLHALSNMRIMPVADTGEASVHCGWTVHQFDPLNQSTSVLFGHYEYTLRKGETGWLIAKKKTILLKDYVATKLDFYSL